MKAYKAERSVAEIAQEYGVHPSQVYRWKKELMEQGPEIFSSSHDEDRQPVESERDELYRKVGHQQVQIDSLKKTRGRSPAELREMIEVNHETLSVREQYRPLGVSVERPNQVWSIDLTYVGLSDSFGYLTAIIDWYSRKVLSWDVSLTMDKSSAIEVLQRALRRYGQPEVFNSDQGVQFTSPAFLQPLKKAGVRISMDGKGRTLDNVIIERFWRTIKYDAVYLNDYASVAEARERIEEYIARYNSWRPHASLNGKIPDMVYNTDGAKAVA